LRSNVPRWLTAASLLLLATLLVGGRIAEGLFVLLSVVFPVALMLLGLGAGRHAARPAVALLGLVLALSALGVLFWPASPSPEQYRLGLPVPAWIALFGLGLVPFVLVVWSYAATFRSPDESGHD
jgi:hypothetical protein